MFLEKNLSNILSATNYFDDICVINQDGYIIFLETKYPEYYEYDIKTYIGKHLLAVYFQDGNDGSMYEVLKTGMPITDKKGSIRFKGGKTIPCMLQTFPIFREKKVVGVIEMTRYLETSILGVEISQMAKAQTQKTAKGYYTTDDIISLDPVMIELKATINKIAKNEMPILIYGDTGTGKEVVAQAIHSKSCRADRLFISQNCAAVPDNLLESIFFGTEKGAYTGAENRKGLFELAEGGTLFLDEINSMSVGMQAKLLKAIEEKKIRRIGGQKEIAVDIRIISALNEEPMQLISEKRLRPDLFYRLGNIYLRLPPLVQRRGDINYLANFFLDEYTENYQLPVKKISSDVQALFQNYSWPGNVRELKNALESALAISTSDTIEYQDLPEYLREALSVASNITKVSFSPAPSHNTDQTLKDQLNAFEKALILNTVKTSSNLVEAARKLGISKQSLNYRLSKYKNSI